MEGSHVVSTKLSTRQYTKGRTRSIDSLRGIAVMLMLAYHFLVWLLKTAARGSFFHLIQFMGIFFAPPMFFVLTGITLAFSVSRQQLQGDSAGSIAAYVLRRYGSLMLIGFALNVIVWGYRSIWIWDVLEVIGLCNILAFFALLLSSDLVLLLVGLLGIGSYHLVRSIKFSPLWEGILHNPLKGAFPIGPFLFFTVVGVVFGHRLIRFIRDAKADGACIFCLQSGGALLLIGLLLHLGGVAVTRYPVSLSYQVLTTGFTLLVLGGFFWWQDVEEHRAVIMAPIMIYGRYALVIYIGHYLVYRLFVLLDLRRQLFLPSSIAVSLLMFAVIFSLVRYIDPVVWQEIARWGPRKTV